MGGRAASPPWRVALALACVIGAGSGYRPARAVGAVRPRAARGQPATYMATSKRSLGSGRARRNFDHIIKVKSQSSTTGPPAITTPAAPGDPTGGQSEAAWLQQYCTLPVEQYSLLALPMG